MRDPARIKRILSEIEFLWNRSPDQRFGQLLQNYVFGRGDIFFPEDDDTENLLRSLRGAPPIEKPKPANTWTDSSGSTVYVHANSQCAGQYCVIHNPSDHHMRDWPSKFNRDKKFLVERKCPHAYMHPDPDSLMYFIRENRGYVGVHSCDGCCTER